MIKIVRNPLDCLLSYAHMAATLTHSATPKEQYDRDLPEFWAAWIDLMGVGMQDDFDLIINSQTPVTSLIPTFVIRFEDLKADPIPVVKDLFKFLLDTPSIEGTVLEKRIEEKCGLKSKPEAIYKLKPKSGNNQNAHMYSEQQIATLKKQLKDFLYYFGYTNHPTEENDTSFF